MIRLHFTLWLRPLMTLCAALVASIVLWQLYDYYTYEPQTRDGRLRADVVPLATDISGTVDAVYVHDNQSIQKGHLLLSLDKKRLRNALAQANASRDSAEVELASALREMQRYTKLKMAVSAQQQDSRRDTVARARARLTQAKAQQELATINLQRADIYSPVDGIVTNLSLRPGTYASAGQPIMTLIDSGSFYVAGYFEETKLSRIRAGDMAIVRVMGEMSPIYGHVEDLSAGINDSERNTTSGSLLANVNPTFSWIRLAQRIPVRITIDKVPNGIRLVAGRTVSISLNSRSRR